MTILGGRLPAIVGGSRKCGLSIELDGFTQSFDRLMIVYIWALTSSVMDSLRRPVMVWVEIAEPLTSPGNLLKAWPSR
jgi:hypothetical protein